MKIWVVHIGRVSGFFGVIFFFVFFFGLGVLVFVFFCLFVSFSGFLVCQD